MYKRQYQSLRLSKASLVGIATFSLLALLLLTLVVPVSSQSADAAEGEGVTMTSNLSTKTTAYLYSMISLSLSDSIDIDLTPNSTGSLGIGSAKVEVSTNNTTGYSLYLATVDQTNELKQVDESLAYSNATSDTSYSIKPLTTSTTASNYLASTANLNTWGYALTDPSGGTAETVYTGLMNPTSTNIHSVSATSSNDEYKLNIAVAADASLPAGAYQNGLIVSAVANPIALSGFNQIYYMQEMTPEICASAKEHEEGQLVDKRDNTIYWVAKLKDGNCWMTQNLALNLGSNPNNGAFGTSGNNANVPYVAKLTPADSDVTEEWVPESSTNEIELTGVKGSTSGSSQYSWSMGKVVLATPLLAKACNTYGTSNSALSRDNLGTVCNSAGFFDVSDWQPTFVSQEGSVTLNDGSRYPASGSTTIAADIATKTYDAHYLIGNYYQWNTAVVGTAPTLSDGSTASSTICPKGWTLPPAGTNLVDGAYLPIEEAGSYYDLMLAYGYPESSEYSRYNEITNSLYTPILPEASFAARPFYFSSGGYVDAGNSYYRLAGQGAWAYTASLRSTAAYISVSLSTKRVMPASFVSTRTHALSVRCIAR